MRSRTQQQSARLLVEIAPNEFVLQDYVAFNPDMITGAANLLRIRLRELLGGLSPIMSEDTLLIMCREVIAEDRPR
ncbi:hypothetical protein [Methylobacterium longum]|uniref:Uncharacterized protein n=1 Tax=Methylobacterium longum TaxID=767694 RepID=A0ABT8AHK6_9HYPH|nr:hypothetical protein [Methylobacterium longum]MDN3569318.1 hypothetical protein [Methylobacterium longum]GJE14611.1 hypothetical protein FOHLNKBM_5686 [Methylobacterium longum]